MHFLIILFRVIAIQTEANYAWHLLSLMHIRFLINLFRVIAIQTEANYTWPLISPFLVIMYK